METRNFTWRGYEWMTAERWGVIHPEKPWAWYDESCVNINADDELELVVKHHPINIIDSATDKVYTPQYGMGLVATTERNEQFRYGVYKWIARMPKGANLWPALWMWSWTSWPPEIDVVEAWSNACGGYFHLPFHWNLQTNFHRSNAERNMAQRWSVFKSSGNPAKRFVEYTLVWEPTKLEFWYDGRLIRVVDDKEFMTYLRQNTERGMQVIMNLHPTQDFYAPHSNPLIIKDFSYEK